MYSNKIIHIASTAVATPPYVVNQAQAKEFLIRHYSHKLSSRSLKILDKIFTHPGIIQRHVSVDDLACLVNEDPDERIARFTYWAVELSSRAILQALDRVGLTVNDVSGLVVNTCTGYICPGISTYLIEKLGLPCHIRVHDLVGSGCGGLIPNLQVCADMLNAFQVLNEREYDQKVVVSVSVEICTATFQMDDDISLILSNAIFADGAAASVLWCRSKGLALVACTSRIEPKYREDIRYIYRNGYLHNQLSAFLPAVAGETVAKVVNDLLLLAGLQARDIKHWAFHPGGEKVINTIRDKVGLSEKQLGPTRDILARYGNMSSPTVLFVLKEILNRGISPGEWCVMVSFGAGLCAHAYLLRQE